MLKCRSNQSNQELSCTTSLSDMLKCRSNQEVNCTTSLSKSSRSTYTDTHTTKPSSFKLNKATRTKLVMLLYTALLSQTLIPNGWKVTNQQYNSMKEQSTKGQLKPSHRSPTKDCMWGDLCPVAGSPRLGPTVEFLNDHIAIQRISSKLTNKKQRALHGNGRNSVDIMYWNLGSRKWQNKTDEIQALVD